MLQIPRHLLPHDDKKRQEILFDYFPEVYVNSKAYNDYWLLSVQAGDSAVFYIDPNIEKSLDFWKSKLDVTKLYETYFIKNDLMISFHSSWALYFWALSLKASSYSEATFVYFSSHNDLMSPCLIQKGDTYIDGITGNPVSFNDPDSIRLAILSGAITNSSHLSFLLAAELDNFTIIHVVPETYQNPLGQFFLNQDSLVDQLLYPGRKRFNVSFRTSPSKFDSSVNQDRIVKFIATKSTNEVSDFCLDGPVFCHFNLNYFNNRFNGQTQWQTAGNSYDPNYDKIKVHLNTVFSDLQLSSFSDRILNTTISLSPGYCASEYWEKLLSQCVNFHKERNFVCQV